VTEQLARVALPVLRAGFANSLRSLKAIAEEAR
jgi:hypothetical protein